MYKMHIVIVKKGKKFLISYLQTIYYLNIV